LEYLKLLIKCLDDLPYVWALGRRMQAHLTNHVLSSKHVKSKRSCCGVDKRSNYRGRKQRRMVFASLLSIRVEECGSHRISLEDPERRLLVVNLHEIRCDCFHFFIAVFRIIVI